VEAAAPADGGSPPPSERPLPLTPHPTPITGAVSAKLLPGELPSLLLQLQEQWASREPAAPSGSHGGGFKAVAVSFGEGAGHGGAGPAEAGSPGESSPNERQGAPTAEPVGAGAWRADKRLAAVLAAYPGIGEAVAGVQVEQVATREACSRMGLESGWAVAAERRWEGTGVQQAGWPVRPRVRRGLHQQAHHSRDSWHSGAGAGGGAVVVALRPSIWMVMGCAGRAAGLAASVAAAVGGGAALAAANWAVGAASILAGTASGAAGHVARGRRAASARRLPSTAAGAAAAARDAAPGEAPDTSARAAGEDGSGASPAAGPSLVDGSSAPTAPAPSRAGGLLWSALLWPFCSQGLGAASAVGRAGGAALALGSGGEGAVGGPATAAEDAERDVGSGGGGAEQRRARVTLPTAEAAPAGMTEGAAGAGSSAAEALGTDGAGQAAAPASRPGVLLALLRVLRAAAALPLWWLSLQVSVVSSGVHTAGWLVYILMWWAVVPLRLAAWAVLGPARLALAQARRAARLLGLAARGVARRRRGPGPLIVAV
jgi:hypothetical protein